MIHLLLLLFLGVGRLTPGRCAAGGNLAGGTLSAEKSDKITADRLQKEQLYEAYNLLHSLAQVRDAPE